MNKGARAAATAHLGRALAALRPRSGRAPGLTLHTRTRSVASSCSFRAALADVRAAPRLLLDGPLRRPVLEPGVAVHRRSRGRGAALVGLRAAPGLLAGGPGGRPVVEFGVAVEVHRGRLWRVAAVVEVLAAVRLLLLAPSVDAASVAPLRVVRCGRGRPGRLRAGQRRATTAERVTAPGLLLAGPSRLPMVKGRAAIVRNRRNRRRGGVGRVRPEEEEHEERHEANERHEGAVADAAARVEGASAHRWSVELTGAGADVLVLRLLNVLAHTPAGKVVARRRSHNGATWAGAT
mmetsp:Transcript_45339/g.119800  ORF Transcript_45339/g.119800 Transcript_45339/m.119800 type:complete len:293 (+) Transcript_45339:13-891(+)